MTTKVKHVTEAATELPGSTLIAMLFRSLFLQASWNFERMQNLGFLYALTPALRRIWREPGERVAAMHRHVEFFNTHPYMAGFCLGSAARLEAEMAAAPKSERTAREARLRTFKSVLASTCAALGDPFFWGVLRPFCALLTLAVWAAGSFWFFYGQTLRDEAFTGVPPEVFITGVSVHLAVLAGVSLAARWTGLRDGWLKGEGVAAELKRLPLRTWGQGLRWAGFLAAAAGALAFILLSAMRGDVWTLIAALGVLALKVWDFSTPALYACTLFVCLAAALIAP